MFKREDIPLDLIQKVKENMEITKYQCGSCKDWDFKGNIITICSKHKSPSFSDEGCSEWIQALEEEIAVRIILSHARKQVLSLF